MREFFTSLRPWKVNQSGLWAVFLIYSKGEPAGLLRASVRGATILNVLKVFAQLLKLTQVD